MAPWPVRNPPKRRPGSSGHATAKSPTLSNVGYVAFGRERDRCARTPTFTNGHAMSEATPGQKRATAALIAKAAEPVTYEEASRLIRDLRREAESFPRLIQEIIEADRGGDGERLGRLLAEVRRRVRHGDWRTLLAAR